MLNYLEETLKKLNIEYAYQIYEGKNDEYIIFDIYDEKDTDYADDESLSVTYYITLNYWHKSLSKLSNYRTIKQHMKKHGFHFAGMKTLQKESEKYGKNFTFTIQEQNYN